ncbi:hypothetical protein QUF74_08575 [Candidatus Halobeggiatoa sp. HSG11]|nr:hypothetical protein [Candidatus Halobeggiatoa sp. HSG11]
MNTSNFEYVFLFLFKTKLFTQEGILIEEPKNEEKRSLQTGILVDDDKRLFLRNGLQNSTDWQQHLTEGWLNICQYYAEQFGSVDEPCVEKAKNYCQQALYGVAWLILDDGTDLEHHQDIIHELQFTKTDEVLFTIGDPVKQTALYKFQSNSNLCLSFVDDQPCFVPFTSGDFATNSVFLGAGFCYGTQEHDAIEDLLVNSKPVSLFKAFSLLIMGQWQFERMNAEADLLRSQLQPIINKYNNTGIIPDCISTKKLQNDLQDIQTNFNKVRILLTRFNGAFRTLDINASNLAGWLEQIRNRQQDLDIRFQKNVEEVQWLGDKKSTYHEPLLEIFHNNIIKLQDHKAYLQFQFDYLVGLQEKWRLYLSNRDSLSGEHLNNFVGLLILLLSGGAGFTINRGIFGVDPNTVSFEIYGINIFNVIIVIAVVPVIWHFGKRFYKFIHCWFKQR